MWANWTRCSGRTATFAPQSTSRNGLPGTGTSAASAGRCTPRERLTWNRPAASAAPVEPPETSASARPSATACTACTIEAFGVERTARAGSPAFAIETGASTTSSPGAGSISAAGPKTSTRIPPRDAASAPPRATSRGPASAPVASSAIVSGWTAAMCRGDHSLVVVIVIVVVHVHDLTTGVGAAGGAHPVRAARRAALRARVDRGRRDLVRRAALVRARVRLLLLGDGHGRRKRVAQSSPAASRT